MVIFLLFCDDLKEVVDLCTLRGQQTQVGHAGNAGTQGRQVRDIMQKRQEEAGGSTL